MLGRGAKLEHGPLQGVCQALTVYRGSWALPQQRSAGLSEGHGSLDPPTPGPQRRTTTVPQGFPGLVAALP